MENPEQKIEQEIKKYIYKDNYQDGKVVFECTAKDILEADEKYKEKIGKDVSKQPHIACLIEKVEETTS